jgi:hypothetical protein
LAGHREKISIHFLRDGDSIVVGTVGQDNRMERTDSGTWSSTEGIHSLVATPKLRLIVSEILLDPDHRAACTIDSESLAFPVKRMGQH